MTIHIIESPARLQHHQEAPQPNYVVEPPPATLHPNADVPQPNRNVLVFNWDVFVSCYDDDDFDGEWRYSAFCPDIDVAMDGRNPEEAYRLLENAIRIKLADHTDVQQAILSPADLAEAISDFLSDGRLCEKTAIRIRVLDEDA